MDFDNFMNELNSDLERRLSGSLNSLNGLGSQHSEEEEVTFCPECGSKNNASDAFCCECGSPLSVDEVSSSNYNGILMTDTAKLASKYSCPRSEIIETLLEFIEESKNCDRNWILFDLGDSNCKKGEHQWKSYSTSLEDFMSLNGISPSPHLSLFIIGGHDVVPQPTRDNPSGGSDEYDSTIFSDFHYCYEGELSLEFLDFNKARCNVGRLPLESGPISTSFQDDIGYYLKKSLKYMGSEGILIGRAVMTSNADWIPASREMSRNLPTEHFDNVEGETLDNMFISPAVMVDMNEELADKYHSSLGQSDMLVFNLHGASDPSASGFYSEGLAFSIDDLRHTSAKIFNTVACWGGRYIRYKREESMLLNALYNNDIMLYSGACVPALGKCGHFNADDTWRIQPAAYSETFMARFCEYLCIGRLNAGEAFLKAKCDYYNMSRMVEDDDHILSTVLMFNLYGNPAMNTKPDIDAITEIQEPTGEKFMRIPYRKMKKQTIMKKSVGSGQLSLLDTIRGAVDFNLQQIHNVIVREVYDKLGVEPRNLYSVEKFETYGSSDGVDTGYLYNYIVEIANIASRIIAKTDANGKLVSAIQTK